LYVVRASGELEVTGHRIADTGAVPSLPDPEARSRMICTVRQGPKVHGALWLTSGLDDAFTEGHQALMETVADLLSLSLHQDAIRSTERLRRERLESLERLLHTMAESLDIRQVFTHVSDVVRGGLPHDVLAMTSWGDDGQSFRVYALAGAEVKEPGFWESITLKGDDRALLHAGSYVIRDVAADVAPDSARARIFGRLGVRSALRIAIPLGSGVFGSLFFLSRQTEAFSDDDVVFGRRVAHHLALALSHQQLAEAARRDIESREMAAQLEAQVATLTRELEARSGHRRVVGHSRQWKDVLAHATRVAHTETTVLLTGESGTGRKWSPGSSTTDRGAATDRSLPSTVPRCPISCSSPSCSGTSAAPSPVPCQ
jgi:transcriptional regulator with GAF, ATPase, and Fis domain